MKTTLTLVAFALLVPVTASAQGGRLNLSFLDKLAERATEKQEITIDANMLKTAGQALVSGRGTNVEAARQVLSELEGVPRRSMPGGVHKLSLRFAARTRILDPAKSM